MRTSKLLLALDSVTEIVTARNQGIRSKKPDTEDKIRQMASQDQDQLLNNLNEYLEIIREPGIDRGSPRDIDLTHLKRFLSRKGLFLKDAHFEELILDGDIMEVYDSTGAQIFRNIEYFNYCSYTVWEVATETWENLYYRPSFITQVMMQEWKRVFESSGHEPVRLKVPKHVLREIGGKQNQCEIEFKLGWALFDANNNIAGALLTERAQKLEAEASQIKFI